MTTSKEYGRIALPASLLVLALVAAACAGEQQGGQAGQGAGTEGTGEEFTLMAMVHSGARTPVGNPVPLNTNPIPFGERLEGEFVYSSVACGVPAPINDIGTNLTTFNGRLPGSRSPASIRLQPLTVEFTGGEDQGQVEGTITLVACGLKAGQLLRNAAGGAADAAGEATGGVTGPGRSGGATGGGGNPSATGGGGGTPGATTGGGGAGTGAPSADQGPDADKDKITISFTGDFDKVSAEEIRWDGEFDITEGTGRYEGIEGDGRIGGAFFCLGPQPCSTGNNSFRDGRVVMIGVYTVPNVPRAEATRSPGATASPAAPGTGSPAATGSPGATGSPDGTGG